MFVALNFVLFDPQEALQTCTCQRRHPPETLTKAHPMQTVCEAAQGSGGAAETPTRSGGACSRSKTERGEEEEGRRAKDEGGRGEGENAGRRGDGGSGGSRCKGKAVRSIFTGINGSVLTLSSAL